MRITSKPCVITGPALFGTLSPLSALLPMCCRAAEMTLSYLRLDPLDADRVQNYLLQVANNAPQLCIPPTSSHQRFCSSCQAATSLRTTTCCRC